MTIFPMLEKTLEQIDGSRRSEYHALVFELVENPENVPPADRIETILAACGKTIPELRQDVARVRERFDANVELNRAEQAAKVVPSMQTELRETETRAEGLKNEFLKKYAVEAANINRLGDEIHRLQIALMRAQQNRSQILSATAARSVRGRLTPEQCSDWKAIDLFASDDPPRTSEVYKPNQQPPSTRNARTGSMSGAGYD